MKSINEVLKEILEKSKREQTNILEECLEYCNKHGVEIESLAIAIKASKNSEIKKELEAVGKRLNLLKE